MKISIRQALPQDAATVTKLTQQLGYGITQKQTQKNIVAMTSSKENNAFVAVNGKEVIGWIGISQFLQIEAPPFCEIRGLVVDENYRGKGIGKMLIEKAKEWGREKGNDFVRLRCNVKRTESILFYRHVGFKEIKRQVVFEMKT